jgi:prepilin-type N-terminal cleavage/methylation domain-containing protein
MGVKTYMKKENGFTLVELIVAVFIGSMLLTGIYAFVNMAQRSSSGIERRVSAQQDARGALELMAMEIQMASYNPLSRQGPWTMNCSGTTCTAQVCRGIKEATQNSITVEMDISGNGAIGDVNNEIIRYVYDTTNKYITRSTDCAGDEAFLGNTNAHSSQKTVSVENNAAGIPVFRYFNGSGNDISASVAGGSSDVSIGIPAIRRIEITLVVDTSTADVGKSGNDARRRIIYSTSVIPRNHFARLLSD